MISLDVRRLEEAGELGRALVSGLPGAGLLVVDTNLRIRLAHGDAHFDLGNALTSQVSDVMPAAAWQELRPRFLATLRGNAQSFESDVLGELSTHWIQLAPIRDGATVAGVMMLTQDITAKAVSLKALADSERLQSSVLAVLDEGVAVMDLKGDLLQANTAARTILGLDSASAHTDQARWKQLATGHAEEDSQTDVRARVLTTGRGVWDVEVALDRPDGRTVLLSANYLPLRDDAGTVSGLVLSFCDVTGRESERGRLLELQDRLREAHEVAGLASWELRPSTGEVVVFQALRSVKTQVGARATLDDLLALVPAEERQEMRSDLLALVRGDLNESIRRHCHQLPDGPAWLETRSRAVRDAAGGLLCVRGTTQDVTAQEIGRQQLARSRDFLQETLDTLPAHVAVLDQHGEILTTNRAWTQFGRDNGAVGAEQGGNYLAACDAAPDDQSARRAAIGLREILARERSEFSMEYPCHSPTIARWFVLRAACYVGEGDARIVVAHTDVTKRRSAEDEIATQAALLDEVDVAVVASALDGRVTHWNRGAEQLYGWARDETTSRRVVELIVPTDQEETSPTPAELRDIGRWEGEFEVYRKDGSTFPAYVRERLISSDDGSPLGTIAVSVDVSERVASQQALLTARNHLQAVTDSMGEGLYTTDMEGRLTYMNQAAEKLLEWSMLEMQGRVLHDFVHPCRPDGSERPVEDSPIMRAQRDGETVRVEDEVFVCRDGRQVPVAYTASPLETEDGAQGCVVVFEDISERRAREESMRRDVEKLDGIDRIQRALAEGRFQLYAQPIIELRTGTVVQHELLLRVCEADGSIVGPGSYLPIAEQYGLIVDIDRWVIQRACDVAATGLPVQINVSARSIGNPTILDQIERCIEQTHADPHLLVFEITETALVEDEAAALAFAERLHTLGCELALDDFGTGYGSFMYLKRLPVDYLKIDVEFVRDLTSSLASRHVVEAVVALACAFSLRTVAEGVEDPGALDLLRELGVDYAQGFHVGRPAPLQ